MNANKQNESNIKMVYSLRVRIALRKEGFEPVWESDNPYKMGLRCWAYEETPAFAAAFSKILSGGR